MHAMAEETDDNESPRQDDWHVMFKIAGTNVNFKLDSAADYNVISTSLFDRLPVA